LFLGLDAMDRDLISQWAEAGILPTFRSLFERATFGTSRNPPGLFVGAVWPSFFTAVTPARHGRYCYEQLVNGTYGVRRFLSSDLKRSPFWCCLSDAGRRIAIIDVPKSPLTPNLNGIQLVNWGTHDPEVDNAFRTWPPPSARQLSVRYGADPVGDCNHIGRNVAGIEAFCRNLEARIHAKVAICDALLEREEWDLFLVAFAESHCVGHQCWMLHDPTHPSHDKRLARAVGNPLQRIYVALDAAVGELLLKAGPDTTVFVLASHGMGPHYDATFMLDDILERLDPQPGAGRRQAAAWGRTYVDALLRRVWLGRPPRLRLPVARRRFFSIPNNEVYGAIRVNMVGREPRGLVHRGTEYDALFADLRRKLLTLVNCDTGQPVVHDVFRVADVYQGDVDDLPDFCVEWNLTDPISSVASPAMGTIRRRFRSVRTGDHKPKGFFWAAGPGIQARRRIEPVSVMDFGATVAALLDVPLPDVDGRPIAALLPPGRSPPASM
jgi:predicted AlkP superfamily phosphohydrolase/phosphomutase